MLPKIAIALPTIAAAELLAGFSSGDSARIIRHESQAAMRDCSQLSHYSSALAELRVRFRSPLRQL